MNNFQILEDIFKNLIFTKVKVSNGFAFYYAKIQTLTADGSQYVILAVPAMYATISKGRINQLEWVSLQTRILKDEYNIEEQVLDYKMLDTRYTTDAMQKVALHVRDRNKEQTEYYCSLPIQIVLLHEANKKSVYQFGDSMDIRQALNSFRCVIKKL